MEEKIPFTKNQWIELSYKILTEKKAWGLRVNIVQRNQSTNLTILICCNTNFMPGPMKKNTKKIVEKIEILKQEIFSSPCPGQLTDCLLEADCQAKSRSRFYSGSPSWPARLPPRWPASEATWPTRSDLGPPCFGHRKIQSFIFSLWAFFLKYLHFLYVNMITKR